jgi:hypothetical protein
MHHLKEILTIIAVVVIGGFLLIGCEEDDGIPGSYTPEPEGNGQIRMYLVDDPADYDQVNIVVDRVEVHRSDPGAWIVVNDSTATYDLLVLTNGANAILADEELEPGHYTQIRLYLDEGSNVVVDGVTYDLEIPSGQQSGLKLNHPFDIEPEMLYELTLDFDAEKSIHQTGSGQYMMNPVIRVIANAVSGSISGIIDPAEAFASIWLVVEEDTVSTAADSTTGEFMLVAIPEGTYDVTVSPTAGTYQDTTITDVGVIAQENTDLGVIVLEP